MADFPTTIFEARETENLPGIVYDAEEKRNFFSEDFQNLGAEITAIEETLGENPQADFDTVADRITSVEELAAPFNPIPHDVVGSKSADGTVYQNTSGKAIFVSINVTCAILNEAGQAECYAFLGETDSPDIFISDFLNDDNSVLLGQSKNFIQNLYFWVPKDWYYYVNNSVSGGGSFSVNSWFESY